MPEPKKPEKPKASGPLVVLALLALAGLAALGTRFQFSSDNPLASSVRFVGDTRAVAIFTPGEVEKILVGMKSTLTYPGASSRMEGRVEKISGQEITVLFLEGLVGIPQETTRLTVDTSIPP